MIMQDAIQRAGQRDGINWEKVAGLLCNNANKILGGIWCSGLGPYSYQCTNAAECYVAYVENYMMFIYRASTGGYAKVDPSGFVELVQ